MENRYIFSLRLKEGVDDREVGRILHSLGAAMERDDCCFIMRLVQLCVCNLYWFQYVWVCRDCSLSVGQSSSLVYCDV